MTPEERRRRVEWLKSKAMWLSAAVAATIFLIILKAVLASRL